MKISIKKIVLTALVAVFACVQGFAIKYVEIGTGTGTSNATPYNNYYNYGITQLLYKASEIGRQGTITTIAFQCAVDECSLSNQSIKIYMAHTTETSLTVSNAISSGTLVYNKSKTIGNYAGLETIKLDTPFEYDGTSNLIIVVCRATDVAGNYNQNLVYKNTSSSGYVLYRCDDGISEYATLSNTSYTYKTSNTRPNIRLTFEQGYDASTQSYEIANSTDLIWFAKQVNTNHNTTINGKVTSNFSISAADFNNSVKKIGNSSNPYAGTFNGNSKTITITADAETNTGQDNYKGLFGYNTGTIQNVRLTMNNVTMYGISYVGGICGYNKGTISGCNFVGKVTGTSNYVGGICGYNSGTVSSCKSYDCVIKSTTSSSNSYVGGICGYNDGTIERSWLYSGTNVVQSATGYVGGICGRNGASGTITSSKVGEAESIAGTTYVGGVCGYNQGTITYPQTNKATITGTQYVGGICGYNTNSATISSIDLPDSPEPVKVTATIEGNAYCGGICGANAGNINNNSSYYYAETHAAVEGYSYVGGVVGDNTGTIDHCQSIGSAKATATESYVGGVAGHNTGTINYGESSAAITGKQYVGGVCGYNQGGTLSNASISSYSTYVVSLTGTTQYAGGICGYNTGTISQGSNKAGLAIAGTMVGAICGYNASTGKITDCTNGNVSYASCPTTTFSGGYSGGICGYNEGGEIARCKNYGEIKSSNNHVGGICGYNTNSGKITDCNTENVITGNSYVGGICGYNNTGSTITSCSNKANVKATISSVTSSYAGGIAGRNYEGAISKSYNTGSIDGRGYVGGIVGSNSKNTSGETSPTIEYCYNQGRVVSTAAYVGGLVGYATGTIKNSYNSGNVSSTSYYCGSLLGYNYSVTCSNLYYLEGSATDGNGVVQNALGASNLGSTATDASTTKKKTYRNFASGDVCYSLNSVDATSPWRQCLSSEVYPSLTSTCVVYPDTEISGVYSNTENSSIITAEIEELLGDFEGDGSEVNPLLIPDYDHLVKFRTLVNAGYVTACAIVTDDITINESVLDEAGMLRSDYRTAGLKVWKPITKYSGVFDGNNHTISGLYIYSSTESQAFIAKATTAEIKNINFSDCYVKGGIGTSILCASLNNSSLSNCNVSGRVECLSGLAEIGGICAQADCSQITKCSFAGSIEANETMWVGGICGYIDQNVQITQSYNTASIQALAGVGGICGYIVNDGSTIACCYNTGNITNLANSAFGGVGVGGIVATVSANNMIENCFNTGIISGYTYVGGVCGYTNGVVQYSFNAGKVNGSGNIGGVCGKKDSSGSVSYCYYDSNVCSIKGIDNVDVADSAYPRTTSQLCGSASVGSALYSGFKTTIWNNGTTSNASSTYITDDNVLGYKIVGTYPSLKGVGEAQNAIVQYANVGTEETPNWITDFIPIYTIEDLKAVNDDLDATYVVMNNLYESKNLSSGELKTSPESEWVPLGSSSSNAFKGKFYGRGFTISGIYMDGDYEYAGLFGYVKGATITGVKLVNSHIVSYKSSSSDYGYVGGIVGIALPYYSYENPNKKDVQTTIEDCENNAYVRGYYAGGICGDAGYISSSKILYCVNKGEVIADYYGGGIAGSANVIKYCYNEGTVVSDISAGIAATCADIYDCYNIGYIEGKYVGGIVGGGAFGTNVYRSYNASELKGSASCGNLIGTAGLAVGTTTYGYYDNSINTYTGVFETMDETGLSEGFGTDDLCISLPNGFSSDNWEIKEPVIRDGKKYLYYPYIKHFGESSAKEATYRTISKVVLNTNGGTCSELTSYIEREGATLPQDVVREGYSFGGWCTNSSCTSDEVIEIPVTAVGEQIFYAKWKANEYTISLDPDGGKINSGDVTNYIHGTYTLLPTDVTRAGYTFDGWYAVSGESADGVSVCDVILQSYGEQKLQAIKIVRAYTGLGLKEAKDLVEAAPTTIAEGMEISIAAELKAELVAIGATVTYANNVSNSSTRAITITDFGDKEFKAKWTVNTYNVTLEVNGGVNTKPITSYTYGTTTQLPTAGNISRTGYDFALWYTNSNFDGSPVLSIKNTDLGDKTFYAKWIVQSYAVDLDADGGTINSGDVTSYTYGVGAMLPTNVTKTGYIFNGWLDENDVVATNIATDATGDKSYTADWSIENYTITYNANEGTYSGATTSYNYGDEVTLPIPTRTGYTFGGWYNNSNLVGTNFTTISNNETGNKEFWAKWEVNTYGITLNVNGGEINSGNITNYTYDILAILPQDVTKTGYTFGGWFNNEACEGTAITQISKGTIGAKTYYAKWTAKIYTVTLQTNNGTINAGNITSYTYGVGATLPTDVTKTGYTFVGWFDNSSYDGGAVTAIANNEVGNKNFWAKWTSASYNVTLNADGGTINSNNVTSYTYGVGAILPTDVTKEGYIFNGWKDAEANDALEIATDAYGDKTFTASWTKATYTIDYNANGGTINDTYVSTYQLGAEIILPTDVEKDGCTFEGWYDNANFTGVAVTAIANTEVGNKTFYANWTANTYTVLLNAQGGTINSGDVTSYTYGVVVSLPTNVTKEGFTFTGWYTNEECTSAVVSIISSTTMGNQTFYAGWSNTAYAVTLNTNNGVISEGNVTSYVYGTAKNLPTSEQVSKTGYTFGGWFNNSSCTGTAQTEILATATGDKEFWAKWTVDSYTISLTTNGGTVNTGNVTKYTYGIGATLPTDVTKIGYTFAGWFDNAEFSGTAIDRIDEYELGNKSFYAKWTANDYAIVYETSAGTIEDVTYATSYTYGIGAMLPTTITKTGCTFAGWFTNSAYEGVAVTELTATDFGARTFYAKWTTNSYAVTLNTNEGIINNGNITSYTFGVGATLPTNVTKVGYTFAGWYDNDEFAGESVATIPTNATNAKEFWAKWMVNSYDVTLNTNGGAINAGSISGYEFGIGATLPTNVTKYGYTFEGWYDNSSLAGSVVTTIANNATGNKSFWAAWSLVSYDVTLNTNGGTINSGNVTTYKYSVGATLPTDVTKTGYTFGGWFGNESCLGESVATIGTDVTGNQTFYAKWIVNSYDIVLNANGGTINAGDVAGYEFGIGATLPTDVTKTGYDFAGWFNNSNLTGERISTVGTSETGNKAFYAKWVVKTYAVTLNTNGGTINSGNVVAYTYSNGTTLPIDVTKTGCTFAGWYESETLTGDAILSIPLDAYGDKAYYAKWNANTYSIELVTNDGTINNGNVTSYTYGVGTQLPVDVTKEGFQFDGWYNNSNYDIEISSISTTDFGNKTYYAKWSAQSYAIAYETNGGTINGTFANTYTFGVGTILPTDVKKSGYDFAGWYTNIESTGDAVLSVGTNVSGDKKYYAKWTNASYAIAFDNNGGTINDAEYATGYTFGTSVTLPSDVTKTGYTFVGWYDNVNLSGDVISEVSATDFGNKTFYAKWTVNTYAISLNVNGGTINSGNVTFYTFGAGANLPSDVTKTGYTFGGWYDVTDSTTQVVRVDETATGDKAFYAKWTANEYSIILVTNEGTINEGNVESYAFGEGATLPTNVTKEGYTFEGWYSNSSYIGGAVTSIANNDSGDKQFWAKWTINSYEVVANYDKTMGTVTGEGSYEYKSTATLKAVTNEGFEFVSWNNGITDKTIQFVVTKDSTVIANFKEKEKVAVVGTLEIPTLKTERESKAIDLTGLFTATEGGDVSYSAVSSQPNVVAATVNDGKLYLTVYEYEGEAEITVTGTLANGEKNSVKAKAIVVLACNIQVADAIKNVSCYDESDGEIALKISNATEPYTIQWTGETFVDDTITNLLANNYTINIEDAEGCTFQKTYTVTQPEEMTMKATIKNPTCSNADGAITVATSGVATATYSWSNEATTQNIANLAKGDYELTITNDETGCQISNNFTLTEPAAPIITVANIVATACNEANGAVTISANEDNLIYSWSNNTQTKNLTNVRAGDYTLNVVNPETNCTASLDVTIPSIALKQPEIAVVTVSQETDNNLVVWLKENTDLIDFYTVYRQSEELGRYEAIAKVPYSELSVYEDTEVDPKEMPWSYKISATDVCGTETELSETHKTMQLIRTQDPFNKKQYDLNWTAYEGLEFSSYIVMRERKLNNRIVIDTLKVVPSDITTYSDTESEEGTIGYYVGIKLPNEINPKTQFLKAESGPFSIALSNIAEAENEEETAVEYVEKSTVVVYAVGHTIYVKNAEGKEIMIYDNIGRDVLHAQASNVNAESEYFVETIGVYHVFVGDTSYSVVVK